MARTFYLLDFRRMTVEKIVDPKPLGGIDTGAPKSPEGALQAEITFGSEPVSEDQE